MKSKALLVLIIFSFVIVIAIMVGYVFFKKITSDEAIRMRVTNALENSIDGEFNIENAHFDLFKGLYIENISFKSSKPGGLRIYAKKIILQHEPMALLRGEILINSAIIMSPEIFALRDKEAVWKFLGNIKAFLDKAELEFPTDHLRNGLIVKGAIVHILDEIGFRNGSLDVEDVDFFIQPFGGSLREMTVRCNVNDGFWKGTEVHGNANFATQKLKLVTRLRNGTMTEELMKEIPAIGEKLWKTYKPTGNFNFDCILDFNNENNEKNVNYNLCVNVIDADLTYIKWPFLVKHVNGTLELSKEGIFLKNLKGNIQNEGQEPPGEIDAFFGRGNAKKNIKLNVSNLNITKKLMKVIPGIGEEFWTKYSPKGNVDLSLNYESNEDKSVYKYSTEAICKGIEVTPPKIPYRLSNIVGRIVMDGENIYFENMSGNLLNGAKTNRVTFDGTINPKSNEKRFAVSIPNLVVTEEMIKSIPKKGEDIWSKYRPSGQIDLAINYTGYEDSSKDNYLITVDCKGNEVEYTELPIKVSNILGTVIIDKNNTQLKNLQGYVVSDRQFSLTSCNGVLGIKNINKKFTFNIFDLKVNEGFLEKLPELFKKGWVRVETGGWLDIALNYDKKGPGPEKDYSLIVDSKGCNIGLSDFPLRISDIDARVNIENGVLVSRNFNGKCSSGKINGSIKINDMSLDGEYDGELEYSGIDLKGLVEKLSGSAQELSGICEGNIKFQGKGINLGVFVAEGQAKLKDGYIAEVPALLSILKLLNLSIPVKDSFHSADIKYSMKDRVVNIEELEVYSNAIELGCLGTIGFDGTLDLTVVIGFNQETFSQIPLIGQLMDYVVGGVRKKLTKVQITGTFSEPQSTMVALKPFAHPIKSIFGLLAKGEEHRKRKNTIREDANLETIE